MPRFTMMVHAKNSVCENSCGLCLATFTAGFVYFEYVACASHRRHLGHQIRHIEPHTDFHSG